MRPSLPPCLRLSAWAVILVIWILSAVIGRPAQPPPPGDTMKPMEMNKVELHRLKNEDLLKQASTIHEKAAQDYLAAARALASVELLLEEAARPADAPVEEKPSPKPADPTAETKAQAAVDATRLKQEAARRQLKLVQARKGLLDRLSAALDAGQTAGVAFLNALDDLKPYAVEIGLRVKDGTLPNAKAPPEFAAEALTTKRKNLAADQEMRKEKAENARKALAAMVKTLEEANKGSMAAEAEVNQAGKALAQEQKRLEMEKTHRHKSTDAMLADLARLIEEGEGLKGAYELALSRFNTRAADAVRLRKALEALKQPEVKVPRITRAEDVEIAARSIQELIDFYSARIKAIENLRAALVILGRQGGEFEADAAVSSEHLFQTNVVAGLLGKAGVAEDRFPDGGQPKRVAAAAERQAKSAAEVLAATEKVKAELVALDKQLAEARQASELAAKQLANLKQSQAFTIAALKWEGQLKGMNAAQVVELFLRGRQDLAAGLEKLKTDEAASKEAAASATETRAKLDGLKDTFLQRAEEQGQAEHQKILGELRKAAGLDRVARDAPPMTTGEPKKPEGDRKPEPEKKAPPDARPELEKLTDNLSTLQQLLAARVRVIEEREERKKELLTALDNLEKKTAAHNATLAEARRLALQLNSAATDLKKRLGKGELPGDKVPDGVTEALRVELRTRLDAEAAGALTVLAQVEQEREQLRRLDPDADTFKAATSELLDLVGQELDLLADMKKLEGEYRRAKKDRPPSEIKRLDQVAADRQSADGSAMDVLLGIGSSRTAKSLDELLEAYYQELIEIEDRDGNLKSQKEKVERLLDLTRRESAAVTKALPLLAKQGGRLLAIQEEETVLTHARLRPEQADELLKAYQTKTGRLLPRPVPVGEKEKAEKVAEMAEELFRLQARVEAIRKWDEVLAARLAPAGIKAEAGHYQEELARLNATTAANTRRVAALTGIESPEPGQVTGGEIGKTRQEQRKARLQGLKHIAIKIAIILLVAFLLPRVLIRLLRRAFAGENSGLVLSALRMFLRAGVSVTALALILWTLGFDVTAILAGLGIGGLAIGRAAQPMIADVIAAMVIFAEGRFKIGDVIKLGDGEPAKVTGLSWRSTQLLNADGLVVHVPNRMVTENMVQNLTRAGQTYDGLDVTVTTEREVSKVLAVIHQALEECHYLTAEHGVSVREYTQKGETKVGRYRFSWLIKDYDGRNKARDEVFARISGGLAHEDLKGTEVTLA